MALATNTIEWFFAQNVANLALATRYDFASQTIQIPETTSRTFRSVAVQIDCMDNNVAATSITSWLIGIKLGAVAFDDVTVTETIANTGEHQSFRFHRNVTSYFVTNFGTGATQTCQVGVTFGALATINICAKLIITYEFDDAATTRVKTVRIPLGSPLATQPTTLTEIGTNQVPVLTGGGSPFLPEASITVDQMTFEVEANETTNSTAGTTDFQLGLALDAESEVLDGLHESALASARLAYRSWIRNDMTTTAAHAFKARCTLANRMEWLTVLLVVTYRYVEADTTVVLTARVLCGPEFKGSPGVVSADRSRQVLKFWVEEPGTITLKQSAIRTAFTETAASDLHIAAGSQTVVDYTDTINVSSETCDRPLFHRVDTDSGMTLARGENSLTLDIYTDAIPESMGWVLYLNYHSGKAAKTAIHAHSTHWLIEVEGTALVMALTAAFAPVIPETNYYAEVGIVADYLGAQSTDAYFFDTECASGEWAGDGWASIAQGAWKGSSETGRVQQPGSASGLFKQYPGSPHARLALETARRYRRGTSTAAGQRGAMEMWLDYHAIAYSTTRAVTGYTGDGSGIVVDIFRADTDEKIAEATTVTGGNYTFVWYDNTIELYSKARQDGTHVGASDNFIAGT